MRPMRQWSALVPVAWMVSLALAGAASATTVDALTFEELTVGADLAGVVECQSAGEVIARYRVVESWKGPAADSLVTIRIPPNVWGPRLPAALVGERFVVFAYRRAPDTMMSTTSGPGEPLWWRRLEPDYELPLFQGIERVDEQGNLPGSKGETLQALRDRAKALLALDANRRQVQVIASLLVKDAYRTKPTEAELAKIRAAPAPDQAVEALAAWAKERGPEAGAAVKRVQSRLEWSRRAAEEAAKQPAPGKPEPPAPPLGEKERAQLRAALQDPNSRRFWEAFNRLRREDCASVVTVLSGPVELDARDRALQAYLLGSAAAAGCQPDRLENLARLAEKGHDPWVRVAGATYLAIEDEARGVPALKGLTALPGGPGAWAAYEMARRGDREALGMAVRVLEVGPSDSWDPVSTIHKRVAVLLSNSAAASKRPAPPLPAGAEWDKPEEVKPVLDWWAKEAKAIQPADPWLAELKSLHQD